MPPDRRQAYADEEPSKVMRYRNGQVTVDDNYGWYRRRGFFNSGEIAWRSPSGLQTPRLYKARTIFSCNPFLPIIAAPDDMTTRDIDDANGPRWQALRFEHDREYPGLSFAAFGEHGMHYGTRQYVGGLNPSWIPSLVPETYKSPYSLPESEGLGGDLPLILALMSFWPHWDMDHDRRMREVFYGHGALWRDRIWGAEPRHRPQGCKSPCSAASFSYRE